MSRAVKPPLVPISRMAAHRWRMRAAGLRPVKIWVPDTSDPAFAALCQRQALAIAAHDSAGDELNGFVAVVQDWPEP